MGKITMNYILVCGQDISVGGRETKTSQKPTKFKPNPKEGIYYVKHI